MSDIILIRKFPLPPSINEMYRSFTNPRLKDKSGRPRLGRGLSPVAVRFKKQAQQWHIENLRFKYLMFEQCSNWIRLGYMLRVDFIFAVEKTRLYTLKNTPKKFDSSNRIKPCEDAISEILGIDDKYFWTGGHEKITAETEAEECTMIMITPTKPRTLDSLRFQLQTPTLAGFRSV